MAIVHPTAVIERGAELGDDVEIGAFSFIGPGVRIGEASRVGHHAVITGDTTIGRGNRIWHHVSLGDAPQDKKYAGEPTRLVIGDGNVIREFCSFNRGTAQDRGATELGDRNWVMAYVHVAHDCVVGSDTVLANCTQLAGHVVIGDHATLGGFTGVHQFCRVGAHVMAGVGSVILQDVPPYVTIAGNVARPYGVNSEGLRRRGFDAGQIAAIKRAYRTLYKSGLSLDAAREQIRAGCAEHPELVPLVDFLARSGRGILR
jgi:UDP-N-acetylglucosamine acyltransferase